MSEAVRTAVLDRSRPVILPDAVTIQAEGDWARLAFRGGEDARRAAAAVFGVEPSKRPMRTAEAGARAALWLGPNEWLLLAPEGELAAIQERFVKALRGIPHSLVDVGNRNTSLTLHGPAAADVLNAGCPLDLDLAAFPVGMCTRTLLGKAEIVLWRQDVNTFRIEVWRSFAPYVLAFLEEAAREYRM